MLKRLARDHFFIALLLLIAPAGSLLAAAAGDWVEGKANYYELKPPITVNLRADTIRYIQVKVQLMSREVNTLEKVEANKPAIIDALITLITAQDLATMSNVSTREKVRTEALQHIQALLQEIAGIVPGEKIGKGEDAKTVKGVEALYFTDFVVQ
jgi:flagellar FliL protein